MRLLTLYVRSRRVPTALAVVLGATAIMWTLGLTTDDTRTGLALAALAAAMGAAALAPGLVGADPALERTAALRWPPRRAAHVLVAGAAVSVALLLTGDQLAPASVLLRDAAGLAGLVAATAAVFGAAAAWVPPVSWAAVALMAGPLGGTWLRQAGTWLAQPAGNEPATVTAIVLAVVGVLLYAARGSRDS